MPFDKDAYARKAKTLRAQRKRLVNLIETKKQELSRVSIELTKVVEACTHEWTSPKLIGKVLEKTCSICGECKTRSLRDVDI